MKQFSKWVDAIRSAELNEASELQKSYQEYFTAKLKKYGVDSPAELSDEKKSKFFNEISADWDKGKGVKPEAKKEVEQEKKEAKDAERKESSEDVTELEGSVKDKLKDLTTK